MKVECMYTSWAIIQWYLGWVTVSTLNVQRLHWQCCTMYGTNWHMQYLWHTWKFLTADGQSCLWCMGMLPNWGSFQIMPLWNCWTRHANLVLLIGPFILVNAALQVVSFVYLLSRLVPLGNAIATQETLLSIRIPIPLPLRCQKWLIHFIVQHKGHNHSKPMHM